MTSRILAGLALCYSAVVFVAFPKWTVDDAYITYRYAANLARFGQLTWNVGVDPVEGYTGVALPSLLALAGRAGADLDLTSKAIGVASYFGGAALLTLLVRRRGAGPFVASLTLALYLTAPFFFTHTLGGLETMLFGAAVLATFLALELYAQDDVCSGRREVAVYLAALVAFFVRPEGAVLALVVAAAVVIHRRRRRRPAGPMLLRLAGCLLLPAVLYLVWRFAYYGQLFPNTYYAKWSKLNPDAVVEIGKFVVLYCAGPLFACALVRAIAFVGSKPSATAPTRSTNWLVPATAAVVGILVLAQYSRSSLVMNFSYRFFAPFFPIMLAALAGAASVALESLRGIRGARRWALEGAIVAAFALQLAANVALLPREMRFARSTRELLEAEHVPAGRYLKERVPADEWLVVSADSGAIPYVSELRTVDFGGLNDEFISKRFRNRIPERRIGDYFFARRPGALVFTSSSPDSISGPEPVHVWDDPRFADYVRVRVFRCPTWPQYFELVYLRRDLATSDELASAH